MVTQLFKGKKDLSFERTYAASIETVWQAWTRAEMLRKWWGPEKTTVPECRVDLQVGGEIYIVTEAGARMGKYQGTRWPMAATISRIDDSARLVYDARSWTEGEEDTSTIHHINDLTLTSDGETTTVKLQIAITQIGPKAKMAAFGMKWGYKQQLDKLAEYLSKADTGVA